MGTSESLGNLSISDGSPMQRHLFSPGWMQFASQKKKTEKNLETSMITTGETVVITAGSHSLSLAPGRT